MPSPTPKKTSDKNNNMNHLWIIAAIWKSYCNLAGSHKRNVLYSYTCIFLTPFCIRACHYTVYTGLVYFIRLMKCQLQTTCFFFFNFNFPQRSGSSSHLPKHHLWHMKSARLRRVHAARRIFLPITLHLLVWCLEVPLISWESKVPPQSYTLQ